MRTARRTAALLTAAALCLGGCSGGARNGSEAGARDGGAGSTSSSEAPGTASKAETTTSGRRSGAPATPEERVDAALAAMSREEEVAQLFLVGVPLDDLHHGDRLAEDGIGGIFLAGRSEIPADDLAATTAAWQERADRADLWIAVDQEGGNVQTLSGPGFAELPTAQEQGQLPPRRLTALADDLGASLARAGINLNLAPVADVVPRGTERENAPIGYYGRQYGATPEQVQRAAGAVVDGMARHGVTAVLKHFPGLGRVRANTDTADEVVDTVTTPDGGDVRAFDALLDSPARPFVMISSAVYTRIDPRRPATWSPRVVTHLLRERLGFEGVAVSDDVGAAEAVQDVPPGERAVRFLAAGGTLVLTVDPGLLPQMRDAVLARDREDRDFRAHVDAAVRTALLAKAHAGLLTG